MKTTANTDY